MIAIFPFYDCLGFNINSQSTLRDPKKVVESFCNLDYRGYRLSGESIKKIFPLVSWQDESSEIIIIIKKYKVGNASLKNSMALVPVDFYVLGSTDFTSFKRDIHMKRRIEYKLTKSKNEWKIKEPITAPHVYWENAINHLKLLQKSEPERRNQIQDIIDNIMKAINISNKLNKEN